VTTSFPAVANISSKTILELVLSAREAILDSKGFKWEKIIELKTISKLGRANKRAAYKHAPQYGLNTS